MEVGSRVKSKIDQGKIKIGDEGIVTHFDNYPGEEWPWTVTFDNGHSGAFNRFELLELYHSELFELLPKKNHTIWLKDEWTDEEPDTFKMSVESESPTGEKFVVMIGNATWLTLEQAKEVLIKLTRNISYIEGSGIDSRG